MPAEVKIELTDIVIQKLWPNIAKTGFGNKNVCLILKVLKEVGRKNEYIVRSLDHFEWELANGYLRAEDGNPVTDPCDRIFRSIAQNGYYRRPKGYVSPEEQAAKEEEEEARGIREALQRAESLRFEAWRDGLSPEELEEAMKGFPGDPKDAWLRKVWKERGSTP